MKDLHVRIPDEVAKQLEETAKNMRISKTELVLRELTSYESFQRALDRITILEIKLEEHIKEAKK